MKNDYLIYKYNLLGFGEKIPYNSFKLKLQGKIKEVKSW
jgi:hypothetical protein